MHVQRLEIVEYPPTGEHWISTNVTHPTLADIEVAIRRLDQHRFPFVILWSSVDEATHDVEGGADELEVMGGKGAYWLAGTFRGYFQRRLDDGSGAATEVTVWTSDQGFADAERRVSRDVEAVARAALYFAEHGDFDPRLKWEDPPKT